MEKSPHKRLGAMFLLQNAVWGAQVVLLSGHLAELGFTGLQISYVLATASLAALCSPLLAGWLADRVHSSRQPAARVHHA